MSMMKKYIFLFLLFTACQDSTDEVLQNVDMPVSFESDLITRGTFITNNNISSMGVMGYHTQQLSWDESVYPVADYFINTFIENIDELWTYTPLTLWPSDKTSKISFFAYSPHSSTTESGITSVFDTPSPGLNFVVADKVIKHIDLLVAEPQKDRTKELGVVNFSMKHALCCVSFWGRYDGDNYNSKIKNITLKNLKNKGTVSLESRMWSNLEGLKNYTISTSDGTLKNIELTTKETQLNSENGYMMLLPQTLTDNDILSIEVENSVKTEVIDINLFKRGITQLNQGSRINIGIIYTFKGIELDFTVEVKDWNAGISMDHGIIY